MILFSYPKFLVEILIPYFGLCNLIKKVEIPLKVYLDEDYFKLYLSDVGILTSLLEINYSVMRVCFLHYLYNFSLLLAFRLYINMYDKD